MYSDPTRGPSRAGVPMETVPILALSGQLAGASEEKLAWTSEQALWPSAASGVMVRASGRVTVTDFACEGEGVPPRVWGTVKPRFRPEAESVSLVVRLALRT